MGEMITEYFDGGSMYIIKLESDKYYYGDGKTINSFGSSANQFLRFNPYFNYVANDGIKPSDAVIKLINENR